MAVNTRTPSERRVELQYEVPGTPEQVWHAIATGPGISSWFAPTDVEEREGGAIAFRMGPGMESSGVVTRWEPSHRFAYEERDWSPNAPPLGTEFIIEARSGGTCTVRLVHSLFADSAEWDDQMDSFETGWASVFDVLRIYMTRFYNQPSSAFRALRSVSASESDTWKVLQGALPALGGQLQAPVSRKSPHEALLLLDTPAPGIALVGAFTWGNKVHASLAFFFFGAAAALAVAREEPRWTTWLEQKFG